MVGGYDVMKPEHSGSIRESLSFSAAETFYEKISRAILLHSKAKVYSNQNILK